MDIYIIHVYDYIRVTSSNNNRQPFRRCLEMKSPDPSHTYRFPGTLSAQLTSIFVPGFTLLHILRAVFQFLRGQIPEKWSRNCPFPPGCDGQERRDWGSEISESSSPLLLVLYSVRPRTGYTPDCLAARASLESALERSPAV